MISTGEIMVALAERKDSLKKFTENYIKCSLCLYPNNFSIEIKHDEKEDIYYYSEVCPRCHHVEEFKSVSKREASRYLALDDLS